MDEKSLLQDIIQTLPSAEEQTLEKIAAILPIEGRRTLRELLKEIELQHPTWRFDDETTREIGYWTPEQFGEYFSDYLEYSAKLHLHPLLTMHEINMPATLEFAGMRRIVLAIRNVHGK